MVKEKVITNVYIDGANLKKGVEFLGYGINYSKLFLWLRKKYKAERVILFLGYIKRCSVFLKRSTTKIVYIENMLEILCEKMSNLENLPPQKEKAPSEGTPVLGSSS